MKKHTIKLLERFCDDVLSGRKNFEVRYNDRCYQAGDIVVFQPVKDNGAETYHDICGMRYEITYVFSGCGLKENWVVFGIKRKENKK